MAKDKSAGLQGVVAGRTAIATVEKEGTGLSYRGYSIYDLAEHSTFEEVAYLLIYGRLPSQSDLTKYKKTLAGLRGLPAPLKTVLEQIPGSTHLMDVMRTGCSMLGTLEPEGAGRDQIAVANRLTACFSAILLYWQHFVTDGIRIDTESDDDSTAGHFLHLLHGKKPDELHRRAIDVSLILYAEHEFNASTFTARVITSTGSDLVSAVVGALGALKGPLHGGAPGPALDMVFEIADASRAEAILRRKIEAGEKLMGFGHRVYKVRDPRADVLAKAAERMYTRAGDMSLYTLARAVEGTAIRLLEEYKPGRRLQTNVEFYTALLLHGLGLDVPLFTPTFAVSRVSGWIAHAFEQRGVNRIIRPQSEYSGPCDRRWVPLPDRVDQVAQN
jgi:2-methylcitrate synthase